MWSWVDPCWGRARVISFLDCFSPHGKNLSGERPIPFLFPPPERWRSNQVALRKWRTYYTGIMVTKKAEQLRQCAGDYATPETRSREGYQEFQERSGCVESLSTVNGQIECQQDCSRVCRWKRFSFQDRHFLAIRTSREDDLCNEMSQDGVIMCHSSSTLLHDVIYYILTSVTSQFFCNCREWKRNRPSTRPIFPCVVKNGLGTRLEPGSSLLDNL